MPVLHNRVSNEELKQRLLADPTPRTTISFYKYFPIEDPHAFRDQLWLHLTALNVYGRIYVAQEGINAQINIPTANIDGLRQTLDQYEALKNLRLNIAVDDDGKSFWVLRIKVRNKVVADGIDDPSFNPADVGHYLKAAETNELLSNPNTIVVDMRNHYEYEVGHFENAIEVPSDTFREQLPMAIDMLKDKKEEPILMYCTGGIRCEKASAYFKHQGFKNVFHIEGGIIEYARKAKEAGLPNKFIGKNFVFDERLGERISDDIIAKCHQCGAPCDDHTNCKNDACHLLFIQCPACREAMEGTCSDACHDFIKLPAEEQANLRKGIDKGAMIFNKSKDHPLRKHRDEWFGKTNTNQE